MRPYREKAPEVYLSLKLVNEIMDQNVPIEKLNGYNNTAWAEDYFTQTIDKKYSLWFYNVKEQTMGSYYGHLSIFETDNLNLPIISSGNVWVHYGFNDTFVYAQKSNCLIFKMAAYQGKNKIKEEFPYLLINPDSKCFAFIPWDFTSFYYGFTEIRKGTIEVIESQAKEIARVNSRKRAGEIIDLNSLIWYSLVDFNSATEIYLNE